MVWRSTAALSWSAPRAAGKSLLCCLKALLVARGIAADVFHIFPLLFPGSCGVAQQFFPILIQVNPRALPPSLMDLPSFSSGSILGPDGIGSVRHRGNFWHLLTEFTHVVPPLPKSCCINPIQVCSHSFHTVICFFHFVKNGIGNELSKDTRPIFKYVSLVSA